MLWNKSRWDVLFIMSLFSRNIYTSTQLYISNSSLSPACIRAATDWWLTFQCWSPWWWESLTEHSALCRETWLDIIWSKYLIDLNWWVAHQNAGVTHLSICGYCFLRTLLWWRLLTARRDEADYNWGRSGGALDQHCDQYSHYQPCHWVWQDGIFLEDIPSYSTCEGSDENSSDIKK